MQPGTRVESALNKISALLTPKRVLLYALALTIVTWFFFFMIHIRARAFGVTPGADFIAFYTAAQIAGTTPEKLYDVPTQQSIQQQIRPDLPPTRHWHYLYPPFFAIPLLALAPLTYLQAYWAWTTASLILYALSILILVSLLPAAAEAGSIFVIAASAPALIWCLLTGQTTALSLFLWILAFYWIKRGKPFFSGFTLGLLSYRFQYLILLAPILLLKKFWMPILGLAISSSALIVTGGWVLSVRSYADYFETVLVMSERIGEKLQPLPKYISIYAFFRPLLPNSVTISLTMLVMAILVYWLAQMWRGSLRPGKPTFDLQFSMTLTMTLLLTHQGLIYDLLLLTVPALIIYENRSWFPPYYKLLLLLLYFAPYYAPIIAEKTGVNPTQPLLIWLTYEIYRGSERMRLSSSG